MSDNSIAATKLLRFQEQIRQEQETFNLRKQHEERWFSLRLRMGYMAVLVLPLFLIISSYIIYNHKDFSDSVVVLATSALFVDVLGLLISVWKLVLNPTSISKTEPISTGLQSISAED